MAGPVSNNTTPFPQIPRPSTPQYDVSISPLINPKSNTHNSTFFSFRFLYLSLSNSLLFLLLSLPPPVSSSSSSSFPVIPLFYIAVFTVHVQVMGPSPFSPFASCGFKLTQGHQQD
ncbi:unnamed protein product [Citrullus colocynthis]|uniref:Transmembrane protein n=1 Tax=Citrullus colocynthis TaxID=252529 RepID=A0ABP0XS16_9ROSI